MSRREYSKNPTSYFSALAACAALLVGLCASSLSAQADGSKKGGTSTTGQAKKLPKQIGPAPAPKPAVKSTGRTGLKAPPLNFSPPEATFEGPVFDWGSVLQGEIVVHDFELKNTGGSVLKVERVKPACGCTTVDHTKEIPPGGVGKITLKIETKKFSGTVKKTAEVTTNASRASQRLTMTGKIDPAVKVEPKLPRMEVIRDVTPEPLTVTLTRASKHPVVIKGVSSKNEVVKPELKVVEDGEVYQILVSPNLPNESKKYHYAQLDVQVAVNDKTFDLPVRVSITVKDRISATPGSVYFSRRDTEKLKAPGAEPASKTLKIESLDPNHSFKITDVQIQGTHFDHRVEPVVDGKKYNLIVMLPKLPEGNKRRIVEKIVVRTDDKKIPEITVNATASIGPTSSSVTPRTRTSSPRVPNVRNKPTPR